MATVPCCLSCHDMKDRFPLEKWPFEWVEKVIQDSSKFNCETKILLTKATDLAFPFQESEGIFQCFYCGFPMEENSLLKAMHNERCCTECYEYLNSISPETWPTELVDKVIQNFPVFKRETRIFLAKALFLYSDKINLT